MSANMGAGFGGFGRIPALPWQRTNVPQVPGATEENPTARPDFRGTGFFNNMAFNQTPFSVPNPYGGLFGMPNFGGSFSPFGSTTRGGPFARGFNSSTSLYRPGSMWGYSSPFGGYGGYGGHGGYGGGGWY